MKGFSQAGHAISLYVILKEWPVWTLKFPIYEDLLYSQKSGINDTPSTISSLCMRSIPWSFSWRLAKSPIYLIKVVISDIIWYPFTGVSFINNHVHGTSSSHLLRFMSLWLDPLNNSGRYLTTWNQSKQAVWNSWYIIQYRKGNSSSDSRITLETWS